MNVDFFPVAFLLLTIYYLVIYTLSNRRLPEPVATDADLDAHGIVLLIPCRDEELVVAETLRGMLRLPGRIHIVVVDDASTDGTAAEVAPFLGERVHLIQRQLPNARKGKGAALNQAFAYAREQAPVWFPDLPGSRVVIGVTDADCVFNEETSRAVVGMLAANPETAAVQTPVGIRGAANNLLLLMQDMEFEGFFYLTQRARHHLGDVGMGGNGQFIRLSVLEELGGAPWSDCLTEDMEISMRMVTVGHRLSFATRAGVMQHGLTRIRPLIRQRARWVQGHYQVWRQLPGLWRAKGLPFTRRFDAIMSLLLIFMPVVVAADYVIGVWSMLGGLAVHSAILAALAAASPHLESAFVVALAFGVQLMFMSTYQSAGNVIIRAWEWPAVAVLFAFFQIAIWAAATAVAFWRMIRGSSGWAKTAREAVPEDLAV